MLVHRVATKREAGDRGCGTVVKAKDSAPRRNDYATTAVACHSSSTARLDTLAEFCVQELTRRGLRD